MGRKITVTERLDEHQQYPQSAEALRLRGYAAFTERGPNLAGIIAYVSTGDLRVSDRSARKVLLLTDQFTLDSGVHWHFFVPKS